LTWYVENRLIGVTVNDNTTYYVGACPELDSGMVTFSASNRQLTAISPSTPISIMNYLAVRLKQIITSAAN
jgi:hypothetical protein